MANIITVSALNAYVKTLLDRDPVLTDIALQGEITNFVNHRKSGHFYFSLRDERASVKAVMFSRDARRLAFTPEDGMHVLVRCRVSLFERDGAFQVYVEDMFPDGIGSAQLAFEQLKARLAGEGLFLAEHKKPLPPCPGCVGVVTSRTGAALQDIIQVLGRRWPLARLLLAPANVQGQHASREVAQAIRRLDADGRADVIIVARGGGSREDLWVFNSEEIARAAYACRIPLISAVGHEIDYTILDFVADERAPTPSAAAELAVPDREEYLRKIYSLRQNIHKNMQMHWQLCYNKVVLAKGSGAMSAAARGIAQKQAALGRTAALVRQASGRLLAQKGGQLAHAARLAQSLAPYRVLARGYALVQDESGQVLEPEGLMPGRQIQLALRDRTAECSVNRITLRKEQTP